MRPRDSCSSSNAPPPCCAALTGTPRVHRRRSTKASYLPTSARTRRRGPMRRRGRCTHTVAETASTLVSRGGLPTPRAWQRRTTPASASVAVRGAQRACQSSDLGLGWGSWTNWQLGAPTSTAHSLKCGQKRPSSIHSAVKKPLGNLFSGCMVTDSRSENQGLDGRAVSAISLQGVAGAMRAL